MHFDVVIVGYRLNAKEPAAKALERILGLNAETARRLARNFPATVKTHLSKDQAQDLLEDLTEAGAQVELHAEKPTGLHKVPPAIAPASSRRSLASSDKGSLDLAPQRQPRGKQASDVHKGAPPPPPAAALANYQLGDFGLGGRGGSLSPAPLHVPPPPPATPGLSGLPAGAVSGGLAPHSAAGRRASITGGMLELDLSAGTPLELDQPDDAFARRSSLNGGTRPSGSRSGSARSGSSPVDDLHALGERFSDAPSTGRGPQVEERAYRSIQRAPRSLESRRPGTGRGPQKAALLRSARDWLPSALMLLAICGSSLAAVGYALDPDDALGALVQKHAAAFAASAASASGHDHSSNLHPMLRMTPAAARGPLAAILRSHIGGVHEVEVIYKGRPKDFGCALIEHQEGETESRLAQVRETGRQVQVPSEVAAQLHEREVLLRAESKRPTLRFTEICLTL